MKKVMMIVVALLISAHYYKSTRKRRSGGRENHANMSVEEMAKKRTDGMIKRFGFPQDLYAKLYPINVERTTAVRKAKAVEPADRAAMKAANENYKAGLQKVLTPAQFQQVKEAWAEAKAKHKDAKGDKAKHQNELED
jgi:hypothetical protein